MPEQVSKIEHIGLVLPVERIFVKDSENDDPEYIGLVLPLPDEADFVAARTGE